MSIDPVTGEVRRVGPGVHLWSKSRRWGDSAENQTPVGGHVVDAWEEGGETIWMVAEIHRGKVEYHRLHESDVDWDAWSGVINKGFVRDLCRLMNKEMAAGRADHLHGLLALSRAVGDDK